MKLRLWLSVIYLSACVHLITLRQPAVAQQPAPIPFAIGQGQGPGNQQGGQQGLGLGGPQGQQGGAASADFDSLIDLITSTVEADSWMENGTGEGDLQPFFNGVFADAAGTLRFDQTRVSSTSLDRLKKRTTSATATDANPRKASALRFISLPRLEAAIRASQANHQPLPEEVLTLAGLERIKYVIALPESNDLVIAGPAGNWSVREDGKILSTTTAQPIVRLDDLLTLWRRHALSQGRSFGVSINPRQAGLARVQDFVANSTTQPIEPSERGQWLEDLRASLGKQDVQFFGIEADSHVARVLLVADYHMKLIGMGIADGVDGVTSYLQSVEVGPGGTVPPMTVLRWWFAMQYDPVRTDKARDVFSVSGLGAKVLSENELLAARGQRVHTGQSDELNQQFASSFSEHFAELCEKYPIYGELRNVFDLSLAIALIEHEDLLRLVGWQPTLFANADWLPLPKMRVPTEVDTVINHRVVRRKHIIAGVSGGVWIDTNKNLAVRAGLLENPAIEAAALVGPNDGATWWWD